MYLFVLPYVNGIDSKTNELPSTTTLKLKRKKKLTTFDWKVFVYNFSIFFSRYDGFDKMTKSDKILGRVYKTKL